MCQLCDKFVHSAKVCHSHPQPQFSPQANYIASESTRGHATWIVNFGASHHITFDFQNLFLHLEYGANEDIMIGDGKGIALTHVGSTTLNYPITNFSLNNVCAPLIKENLLFISQFCNQNNTSIEFFPDFFIVKDLTTRASLAQGQNKGHVYEWPTSTSPSLAKPLALLSTTFTMDS